MLNDKKKDWKDSPPSIGMDYSASQSPTNMGSQQHTAKDDVEEIVLQELVGYVKIALIGHGSFGEVWKALAPGGVEVALKLILQPLNHAATRRELKALEKVKSLNYPFLLKTHAFGMFEGKLTIIMELADGSLSDLFELRKTQWIAKQPSADLLEFFRQAAEALDYLQEKKISHRDVKPQNLLYLGSFAKVADFGLARGQDQLNVEASAFVGTPAYMSPELWKQTISRTSDQYGLAATYAEMRLGRLLFQGSLHDVFLQHLEGEPDLKPLPKAEQEVLKRALAKDPEHRYPNCSAFVRELKDASAPPGGDGQSPSRFKWFISGGAVLLLLIAVAVGVKVAWPTIYWQPLEWNPVKDATIIIDSHGRRYYQRLERDIKGIHVAMVAIPRLREEDPPTFYMMEDKVKNNLYEKFMADPESKLKFDKYSHRNGCDKLISKEPSLWKLEAKVDGEWGELPVFRVTVTEAHCFAEWLGGRLPTRKQWMKAFGVDDHPPGALGPYSGPPTRDGIAVGLADGPWPVNKKGDRDVSFFGVRQMAGNGREWTRDAFGEPITIPLESMVRPPPRIWVLGRSYESQLPLTFDDLNKLEDSLECTDTDSDLSFRVVIEKE